MGSASHTNKLNKLEPLARGRRFHALVREDWLKNTKGVIGNAVHIERSLALAAPLDKKSPLVLKRTGGRGRMDVFVEVQEGNVLVAVVVEAKSSNWDSMTDPNFRRNVARHARQIWKYINSHLIDGVEVRAGIIYEAAPSDPARLLYLKEYFDSEFISLVFFNEA